MIRFIKELLEYSFWLIPILFWSLFITFWFMPVPPNTSKLVDIIVVILGFISFIIAIFSTIKAKDFNKTLFESKEIK